MVKMRVISLVCAVFMLSFVFVGCSNKGQDVGSTYIGTWDLVELTQDSKVSSKDELDVLKENGLEIFVNFNENGSMGLAVFGDVISGTWKAKDKTSGTREIDGQSIPMTIKDSKLTFEQEGTIMTFTKGEHKDLPTKSSDSATSSSAAQQQTATEQQQQQQQQTATEQQQQQQQSSDAQTASAATSQQQ